MGKSSQGINAVNNAFALLGKTDETATAEKKTTKKNSVMPTAKVRNAISLLSYSTPQKLYEDDMPLKPLLQDLFNWDGKNHVNKPLVAAFNKAINTPGKYPHAVELTSYLSALAPMLEADQIARMYALVDEVDSAFAPTKYTLQFSNRLKTVLGGFSKERVERLGASLWKESHAGRWWNMTAGIDINDEELNEVDFEEKSAQDIFEEMKAVHYSDNTRRNQQVNIEWNPQYNEVFSKIPMDQEIASLSEEYSDRLESGEYVHPDIAIYLSSLNWLAPYQRPESPINGLLKYLIAIVSEIPEEDRKPPKKPRKFSDLFPNIYLQAGATNEYPVFNPLKKLDGQKIVGDHTLRIIKSRVGLAENAKFMGNCTLSYEDRIKNGSLTLLYIEDGGNSHHNISVSLSQNGQWKLGEVNARFNRGANVDRHVEDKVREIVHSLPRADHSYMSYLNYLKDAEGKGTKTSFDYSLF